MAIEERFETGFVAAMALREKQIQQNYRPIIAVHKWFARRPGTLFRGLILAEFADAPLAESFFTAHDFPGRTVADPFMGGGTPLVEVNRVGCDVVGFDINPMAAWVVREEIDRIDLDAYRACASELLDGLRGAVGDLYRTDCPLYGDRDVPAKYFLWVKQIDCASCRRPVDLFPGYLLAGDVRHPRNVLVCPRCGQLNEVARLDRPGTCSECAAALVLEGPARRNRCRCPHCDAENRYPRPESGPPRHRLFAIEYFNLHRKAGHRGRFFKRPDSNDIERFATAARRWGQESARYVPEQAIPPGDETDRLHRWGYRSYRELFNPRQLLGLELSARRIAAVGDERLRHALATNLSDLLRYQNMVCRYDTMALKSLDVFSVHGFPVGLVQCESNLLGIADGAGANVGSGGWGNIIEKYARAKAYCDRPFEVRRRGARKVQVPIEGEWIGERRDGARPRAVTIRCASATEADLPAGSLDAVFTDPPYFGNVQYGELMDFCYVWLRRLVGGASEGFGRESTRAEGELTGNVTRGRGLEHFTEGLAAVYARMAAALKPGGPLAFTYHHNAIEAYQAVAVAILDAGLTCSATIPCPAEMGGSIHIHGTGSSIVDTVFVCRARGATARKGLFADVEGLIPIVADELDLLRGAGLKPTRGDIRCIVFGHITRMAVWNLRDGWDAAAPTAGKLERVARMMASFGVPDPAIDAIRARHADRVSGGGGSAPGEDARSYDAVGF